MDIQMAHDAAALVSRPSRLQRVRLLPREIAARSARSLVGTAKVVTSAFVRKRAFAMLADPFTVRRLNHVLTVDATRLIVGSGFKSLWWASWMPRDLVMRRATTEFVQAARLGFTLDTWSGTQRLYFRRIVMRWFLNEASTMAETVRSQFDEESYRLVCEWLGEALSSPRPQVGKPFSKAWFDPELWPIVALPSGSSLDGTTALMVASVIRELMHAQIDALDRKSVV